MITFREREISANTWNKTVRGNEAQVFFSYLLLGEPFHAECNTSSMADRDVLVGCDTSEIS